MLLMQPLTFKGLDTNILLRLSSQPPSFLEMSDFKKKMTNLVMEDTVHKLLGKNKEGTKDTLANALNINKLTLAKTDVTLGDLHPRRLAYTVLEIDPTLDIDTINMIGGDVETTVNSIIKTLKKRKGKNVKKMLKFANMSLKQSESLWLHGLLKLIKAGFVF